MNRRNWSKCSAGGGRGRKRVLCVECDNMSLHEEMCKVTDELK